MTWKKSFTIQLALAGREYRIEAELPGVSKEDIILEGSHDQLRITVKRAEMLDENQGEYIHRERRFGSMERSLHLADMDEDQVSARCESGILHITVPKKEIGQQGKHIPIE